MYIRRAGQIVAVVSSLAGAIVSYELLVKHVGGTAAAGWFEAGCTDSPEPGQANCAAVLASPYSYFPAKTSAGDHRPRLPAALLGLGYYSALTVWFLCVGRVSPRRRWLHAVLLLGIGMGLAMSAYFTSVMFRRLDQWCPWCMVTHGLNVLIAICAILMWPGRPRRLPEAAPIATAPALAPEYPSRRLVLVTLFAIAAVALAELFLLRGMSWKRQAEVCINRTKADAETLFRNWQAGRVRTINVRSDDPTRTASPQPGRPTLDLTVFSDFECPSCARFASFIEEQVQPFFDGSLRTTFKHYPLDRSCNDRAGQTMHPHACEGAALVEAARMLGGNEAFWRAHDFVFKNREALAAGQLTPQAVASASAVDAAALASAMQSEQIRQRVAEDAEQGKLAEIRGTPAVFVDGKLVETSAVPEIGFWDKVADMYWRRINVPRPDHTRPKPAATPGSPGRKDAP